jgi:hypothetical protein
MIAAVPTALRIIRQTAFKALPWKNGGGTTHEAFREPASGDAFLWRVSVAHIESSGPFSDFAGYNRKMVLLRGLGLTLQFADGEQRVLRRIGESVEFDGAVAAHCDLLNGPCVDLNFIVSKSVRAHARVERVDKELLVRPTQPQCALIFSITDPLLLECDAAEAVRLESWDLAVLSQGGARLSKIAPDEYSAPSAVFFATINH